jgi:hypothetical protein
MSVLEKIAFYQNRRDEVPNQELAKALAESGDVDGIAEIAAHLWDKNQNVQSDCVKVLYEVGYLRPELIVGYASDFLKLLHSKNNRMVWGAMIALGTVADRCPEVIWAELDTVIKTVENGSVITLVWGVKALAKVAAANPEYNRKIFPFLLDQLKLCVPRDVPTHGENMLCALTAENIEPFLALLESRKAEMSSAQLSRLKTVVRRSKSNLNLN